MFPFFFAILKGVFSESVISVEPNSGAPYGRMRKPLEGHALKERWLADREDVSPSKSKVQNKGPKLDIGLLSFRDLVSLKTANGSFSSPCRSTTFFKTVSKRLFCSAKDCFPSTRLLQLRPFFSRMLVVASCDHGLAQLGLAVLVRGLHAVNGVWISVNAEWKEVWSRERRFENVNDGSPQNGYVQ